jgi:uncharacterized iron-regulated membrane protein
VRSSSRADLQGQGDPYKLLAAAGGSIFLFNMAVTAAVLKLNTKEAGSINGTAQKYSWKPYSKAIGRTPDEVPRQAQFGDFNELTVTYPQAPAGPYFYRIDIDPDVYPLEQNFQLILYYTGVVLCQGGLVVWNNFHSN